MLRQKNSPILHSVGLFLLLSCLVSTATALDSPYYKSDSLSEDILYSCTNFSITGAGVLSADCNVTLSSFLVSRSIDLTSYVGSKTLEKKLLWGNSQYLNLTEKCNQLRVSIDKNKPRLNLLASCDYLSEKEFDYDKEPYKVWKKLNLSKKLGNDVNDSKTRNFLTN
ncbi:MAG: hypothetical protein OXB88_08865 [Bacteriovoracales bacterium]|nr:hypothetical protein [Bacteriovoracales bacterium]